MCYISEFCALWGDEDVDSLGLMESPNAEIPFLARVCFAPLPQSKKIFLTLLGMVRPS